MGKLLGLILFFIGIGIVIGLLIADTVIAVVLSGACLLCGYHLFCHWQVCGKRVLSPYLFFVSEPSQRQKNTPVKHGGRRCLAYALSTFPDLRQEVHTYIFFAVPLAVFTLTDFTLDFHILLDLLWEWLTLFPKWAPLSQIAHLAMIAPPWRFFSTDIILTEQFPFCK